MLQLRPGLSFGFVADRAVVLDLEADRYFLLDGAPLRLIRDAMANRLDARRCLQFERLGARPLFIAGHAGVAPVVAPAPVGSALERAVDGRGDVPLRHLFAAQCRANGALKFLSLESVIARWRAVRPQLPARLDLAAAISLAQGYAAKRPLLPLRRSCVPDSLAIMRLLWRHRLDADLFFGVRLEPFAAHCWVQSGDLVLSDPLSNVVDFTPVFRL